MMIKKRSISILLSIIMILGMFGVLPFFNDMGTAQASTRYKITITSGPLTVRKSYSTSSSALTSIPKGKTVYASYKIKDAQGHYWYKASYKNKTGYIYAKYAKLRYTKVNYKTYKVGTVTTSALNVRAGASTSSTLRGKLDQGKSFKIKGWYKVGSKKWYKLIYKSKISYVYYKYVKVSSKTTVSAATNFESYMTAQGFPESYKESLRKLHAAHPKWVFKAQKTGLKWSSMLSKEKSVGNNLVEKTDPDSWKSKYISVYNFITKKYKVFDGKWNQASKQIIAYYLDPRNFLTESQIYQFMGHKYDAASQNTSTIKSITSKYSYCFMNNSKYITYLNNAGKKSNINPNVITAMVIMEQGWKGGSGLISGAYSDYKGYYNHFNVGAYTAGGMNSTERGLWYAKGEGQGNTSYGRPWNTIEKSLTGGASFYASNYVNGNQYTYYTKKFNVTNGLSKVATHEYMTNVYGASSEGVLLSYAYRNNSDYPNTFYIPIYSEMPSKVCEKPKS